MHTEPGICFPRSNRRILWSDSDSLSPVFCLTYFVCGLGTLSAFGNPSTRFFATYPFLFTCRWMTHLWPFAPEEAEIWHLLLT